MKIILVISAAFALWLTSFVFSQTLSPGGFQSVQPLNLKADFGAKGDGMTIKKAATNLRSPARLGLLF
jgi:hypothetical protein